MRRTRTAPALALALALALGACASSPQPAGITARFFPDPEVALDTPAFRKDDGFTTHAELMAFLAELAAAHPDRVRVASVGKSQEGREIPIVFVKARGGGDAPLRVFFQGGLHGDEPASTEGLLHLLRQLLDDPEVAALLDGVELAVIPCANVDGFERQFRMADDGLDLNRDQTKLMVPETRLLKAAFNAFAPEVAVDFHEFRPYRRDFARFADYGVTHRFDVMFLHTGNLNVPAPLRSLIADTFVADAEAEVARHGLVSHEYITTHDYYGEVEFNQGSTNARSSATSFALANTVSTLVEVRGVGLERTSFKRRVMTTFWIAASYLRTAASHADAVRATLAESAASQGPVVVTSARRAVRETIPMIDVTTEQEIPVEVTIRDALETAPRLVRARPWAYVLRPEARDLAERLRVLGLTVSELPAAVTATVETYRVTSYRRAPKAYEGMIRQTVKTRVEPRPVELPAGSFVVRMDQPRANLVGEVLEPETENGFVSFGVLATDKGEELPYYRAMTPLVGAGSEGN